MNGEPIFIGKRKRADGRMPGDTLSDADRLRLRAAAQACPYPPHSRARGAFMKKIAAEFNVSYGHVVRHSDRFVAD